MLSLIRPALVLFTVLTLLTGIIYPLLVTITGNLLFPYQSAGSLIIQKGIIVGSELIGQNFSAPRYFWSRPSATSPMPYNASASSGSNLAPTHPQRYETAKARIASFNTTIAVPIDLVTTSASGLDPHISLAAAYFQMERVAQVRHLPVDKIKTLIDTQTEGRQLGFLGEPRVNVMKLNLALDTLE
jgi:potassium-transporting ATPase KdpC subunit